MRTRVLIAGAGALGSVIGALLSKNAHVTLLGRKWHIDAINKKGLQITGVRNFVVNIRAVHDVNLLEKEYDYIFVTVKAYDTENIAIEMKEAGILAKGLVSFQNGVGNLEVLSQYFADLAIIGAVTTMGANVIGPGIVECAGIGDTYIGAWSRCSNAILHDLHTLLTSSAIPAQIVDDIEIKIWEKCAINSCINPLTAIFGIKNGELLKNKSLLKLMQIVAMEWGEVCRKAGIEIEGQKIFEMAVDTAKRTAMNRSSMLQDVTMGRKTEIDHILAPIIDLGKKHGILTPLCTLLYERIKCMEEMKNQRK